MYARCKQGPCTENCPSSSGIRLASFNDLVGTGKNIKTGAWPLVRAVLFLLALSIGNSAEAVLPRCLWQSLAPLTSDVGSTSVSRRKRLTDEAIIKDADRVHGDPPRSVGTKLESLAYLRNAQSTYGVDPNFLRNAIAAHREFKEWFKRHLDENLLITESGWRSSLKDRHLTATGVKSGTPHMGPGNHYRSDSKEVVNPGVLRSESFDDGLRTQEAPDTTRHAFDWLHSHGFPVPEIRNGALMEVNGLEKLLQQKCTQLQFCTISPLAGEGTTYYPLGHEVPLFERLGYERFEEIFYGIKMYQQLRTQPGAHLEEIRERVLDSVADYLHTTTFGHYFGKVNYSMHMGEVNTFLEALDLRPIQGGALDLVALRMDYKPFRRYFRWYADRYRLN